MKQIIFFLFISITSFSQQKDNSLDNYSDIFKLYKDRYQTVVVQYPGGFWGQKWTHYRIIYKQKRHWFLVDHFASPIKLFKDSVDIRKCHGCDSVYRELVLKGKNLISEKDISTQCIKRTAMVNHNGDSVIRENNLLLWTDLDVQVLEFSNGKNVRRILQLSPSTAQQICPDNQERKLFRDFVNAIKNVK